MSVFSGCSSSPAQLKSGSASATAASETAAGRLGHRTDMPAAPDAAAPASAAASGHQRSCKGLREPSICETSADLHLFWVIFCFQRHAPPQRGARQCASGFSTDLRIKKCTYSCDRALEVNVKGTIRLFDHHIGQVLSISFMAFCESMSHVNDIDKTMDVGRRFAPSMREHSLEARTV